MKESIFNKYCVAEDGTKLAFNSFTCALAVVDETYDKLIGSLSGISHDNVPQELKECFDAAVTGHYIVEDDCDELLELSIKRNFLKYKTDSLGLTIAPTLACNFKCIYCYETSKVGVMSEVVQSYLLSFVEQRMDTLKNLDVSWYGGEPLLAKDVIYALSEKMIGICEEKGVEYNAYMVTNGSLLDDATIEKLILYKVKGVQITLDGAPSVHNSRRVSKNGCDSFDLIVENINKVLKTEKIDVAIRVNVDKTNSEHLSELFEILSQRLISRSVKISFGQVSAYTEACKSVESQCYNNSEFSSKIIDLYAMLNRYGFSGCNNSILYPRISLNYCCAELLNSFVVDHEGYLYKCWNVVGMTEHSVGRLEEKEYDITCEKNARWVERNPIINLECKKCELLPICMGGCPYEETVLGKKCECNTFKYNIEDIMFNYLKR